MSERIKGLIEIFFGRKTEKTAKGSADGEPDSQIEFDFEDESENIETKKGDGQ